ncbi:MAG: acyl-CoA desaturase [Pseudomonadota bacterium]
MFRVDGSAGDCVHGTVRWAPVKSLWINGCLLGFVGFAPWHTTTGSVVVFIAFTYLTLLLGHSVGMHRKLIHRTYECPKWLERILVYLGVLVGMGGPFDILRIHDVRDWAQREPECHDFTHNPGPGRWRVPGAGVQASDLPGMGLLTLGECWHNNHHAFPESARIGLEPGEVDPGWWVVRALERLGLVWDVGQPRRAKQREDIEDRQCVAG